MQATLIVKGSGFRVQGLLVLQRELRSEYG